MILNKMPWLSLTLRAHRYLCSSIYAWHNFCLLHYKALTEGFVTRAKHKFSMLQNIKIIEWNFIFFECTIHRHIILYFWIVSPLLVSVNNCLNWMDANCESLASEATHFGTFCLSVKYAKEDFLTRPAKESQRNVFISHVRPSDTLFSLLLSHFLVL